MRDTRASGNIASPQAAAARAGNRVAGWVKGALLRITCGSRLLRATSGSVGRRDSQHRCCCSGTMATTAPTRDTSCHKMSGIRPLRR
jgi:hypothetical protein